MLADGAKRGWRDIEGHLGPRQRVLCAFAEKLTRTPARMTADDLEPLRAAGLTDAGILDTVHIIGWFNWINRVADALGVDLEKFMPPRP